jgi:hypothetical protein
MEGTSTSFLFGMGFLLIGACGGVFEPPLPIKHPTPDSMLRGAESKNGLPKTAEPTAAPAPAPPCLPASASCFLFRGTSHQPTALGSVILCARVSSCHLCAFSLQLCGETRCIYMRDRGQAPGAGPARSSPTWHLVVCGYLCSVLDISLNRPSGHCCPHHRSQQQLPLIKSVAAR